jgi:hypothetical protein
VLSSISAHQSRKAEQPIVKIEDEGSDVYVAFIVENEHHRSHQLLGQNVYADLKHKT